MTIQFRKILLISSILTLILFAVNIDHLQDPFKTNTSNNNDHQINAYVINLKRCPAVIMSETIAPYFPNVLFRPLEDSEQLIFTAKQLQYKQIKELVRKLDLYTPQVAIQVKVIEIAENTLKETGLLSSLSHDGLVLNQTSVLDATFKMLIAKGEAFLLAAPRIKSLCGSESIIHIGDKIPYTVPTESAGKVIWNVRYLDAGINLKLFPKKVIGKYIELKLKPEVSSIKQWKMTAAGEYPIISTRMTSTLLRLKNNETLLIGGLLNEEEKESVISLPFFSKLPLVGNLFQRKITERIKTDIVFLVTAEIL